MTDRPDDDALAHGSDERQGLSAEASALIAASLAPNTRRAYARWWTRWDDWCEATGRRALPGSAESLASFVAVLAGQGHAPASIGQAVGAFRSAHALAGHPDQPARGPAAKAARAHRRHQADQGQRTRRAPPLTIERLRAVVEPLDPDRAIDARDHALLVLGFAGCLRRSELVALNLDDLTAERDRLTVTIRRAKTDQDARGRTVDLPYGSHRSTCPVRALEAWLTHLPATDHPDHDHDHDAGAGSGETPAGPGQAGERPSGAAVFRPVDKAGRVGAGRLSAHSASTVITRRAAAAGLGAAGLVAAGVAPPRFTGHSLRAGGATSMAATGATTAEIAEHGGWSPTSAVVHTYVRRDEAWRRNAMRNVL